MIKTQEISHAQLGSSASLVKWTNNNCESTNVILKHAMHWKSLPLPALVLKLYDVVRCQYDDIRCALVGQGDYVLCPRFKRFTMPIHTWANLSLEKKYTQYRRFLRQTAIANSKRVTLTNGKPVKSHGLPVSLTDFSNFSRLTAGRHKAHGCL